jgi:hypothetical protein
LGLDTAAGIGVVVGTTGLCTAAADMPTTVMADTVADTQSAVTLVAADIAGKQF